MSRLAPTSTPRVGSSSTTTRGCGCSTLASASFCWLPPDSDEARCAQVAGADAEGLAPPAASAASSLAPGRARAARSAQVHQREVLAQAEVDMQALALAVFAQVGDAFVGGFARVAQLHRLAGQLHLAARCVGRRPSRPSNSSVRPAPTRPAKPRISPGRTSKLTSCAQPGTLKPRTCSSGAPCGAGSLAREQVGQLAAHHQVGHVVPRQLRGRAGA